MDSTLQEWLGHSKGRQIIAEAAGEALTGNEDLIKVVGTRSTSVIFMGDIWRPRTQWDSRYLWMPLEIGDGKLVLPEPRQWTLDIATGEAVINRDAPAMVLPPPAPRRGPGGGTAPAPTSAPAGNP